ncbi:MAG TPA: hypothetical protein VFF58_00260, partial [Candidatus Nitrosotalea sp.]|nr:hypothetical protein [Candidatus Nitrosotalea sp.]
NNKAAQRGVAVLRMRIGDLLLAKDDMQGAMSSFRSALDVAEKLSAADPTNTDASKLVALAYKKVGGAEEESGNLRGALDYYRRPESVCDEFSDV